MEDYLKDRGKQITKLNGMMNNILHVADQIGATVDIHGNKLEEVKTDMEGAKENVQLGNEQLD